MKCSPISAGLPHALCAWLLMVALPALADDRRAAAPASQPAEAVVAVGPIRISVADLERSIAFYADVLTFEPIARTEYAGAAFCAEQGLPAGAIARAAGARLGDESIELIEFDNPRGRPLPADSRSNDRWFQHIAIIVRDMDAAYARLQKHAVRAASAGGPQRLPDWNPTAGGIRAFYFRDPDGHYLEILQFPPGKGDAKWHAASDRIFLGIDHTAIVVADTAASLRFYRDGLGLRVAGESVNHGVEQERLNNVRGARLRITTLRAPLGPGIELLEYLEPRDGRPYPSGAQCNDLLSWQPTVYAAAPEKLFHRLRVLSTSRIGENPADSKVTVARDPDGHALRIATPPEQPVR
ncbi:MAG: VOC family protein [Phycisphaerae bacterium]|nr:VOC family protein [Phycisphaerae bacterium]